MIPHACKSIADVAGGPVPSSGTAALIADRIRERRQALDEFSPEAIVAAATPNLAARLEDLDELIHQAERVRAVIRRHQAELEVAS